MFKPAGELSNGQDVLRRGRGPQPDQAQEGRRHRLRFAGARTLAQLEGQRRTRESWTLAQQPVARQGASRRTRSGRRGRRREMGRRDHGARAGHHGGEALSRCHRAESHARKDADVRSRIQHPLRHDHRSERRRRLDGCAEVARTSRSRTVRGRRRHTGPHCHPPGRHRPRQIAHALCTPKASASRARA